MQDAQAERVDRAERDWMIPVLRPEAFLHFRGSGIGKSHHQDVFGVDSIPDHVVDPSEHGRGLSGSRTADEKHRSVDCMDRFLLRRVLLHTLHNVTPFLLFIDLLLQYGARST